MSEDSGQTMCCATFKLATQEGTDSERYGALIGWNADQKVWEIGGDPWVVRFCPWCGASKKRPCGECHLKPGETCDVCGATESQ